MRVSLAELSLDVPSSAAKTALTTPEHILTLSSDSLYPPAPDFRAPRVKEQNIEKSFIEKLNGLKYTIRSDITGRAVLERNENAAGQTMGLHRSG